MRREWIEMVTQADPNAAPRIPLSKERVLRAAVDLADRGGSEAVSMRKLGQELGVDAMSLYHHVHNKDDILDGIVDVVVGEIERPRRTPNGRPRCAGRCSGPHGDAPPPVGAARDRVADEPGSRDPGYMESVLAILRDGGFSIDLAHHALHVMGSRVLGFNQDLYRGFRGAACGPEAAAPIARQMAGGSVHRGARRWRLAMRAVSAGVTTTSSSRSGSS